MSWISDLAGKAEDILNKIDQNAANVLQQPTKSEFDKNENQEVKTEESLVDGLTRNLSSSSLSLSKSLTPKKFLKNDSSTKQTEDRQNGSNLSSRRSSFSSRAEGTVIEQEINSLNSLNRSDSRQSEYGAEKELGALRIALAEITTERDELKDELFNLQEELKDTKGESRVKELESLINTLTSEKDMLLESVQILKETNTEYVKSISELEANLIKARQNILELTEKLNWQIKEADQKNSEFQQYRKKAQVTLQMKDKIIEEFKSKGPSCVNNTGEYSTEKVLQSEIDNLREENLTLKAGINELTSQLENFKSIIQKLEKQNEAKANENLKMQDSLKENLLSEQQRTSQMEVEIRTLNQEITAIREEMNRQRQTYSTRLHEKENELMKLRSQTTEMPNNLHANSLENRIQSLTQTLVQKQSSIEAITAERNALKLQLEKVEEQLRHLISQNRQQRNQIINVNDTDDAKAQLPSLMRENPFDTNVARRVKRAYSTLDSAGIRIGVFLRRYPLVRIMVLIYVALLHLWVMFVLLSSTPM